jgi:hypothetical protein
MDAIQRATKDREPPQVEMDVVETQLTIKVDGLDMTLHGCAISEFISGGIELGDVGIVVRCPEGLPGDGLALARLESEPFELLINATKAWLDPMMLRSRPPRGTTQAE